MTLKFELAEAQDKVDRLKDENATQSAVIEMLRIRCGALESHVRDLERAYQLVVHQNAEDSREETTTSRIKDIMKADQPRFAGD